MGKNRIRAALWYRMLPRPAQWLVSAFMEWWHWHGFSVCVTCWRLFPSHAFWNPWRPDRRLACSERCCEAAKPRERAEGMKGGV